MIRSRISEMSNSILSYFSVVNTTKADTSSSVDSRYWQNFDHDTSLNHFDRSTSSSSSRCSESSTSSKRKRGSEDGDEACEGGGKRRSEEPLVRYI